MILKSSGGPGRPARGVAVLAATGVLVAVAVAVGVKIGPFAAGTNTNVDGVGLSLAESGAAR
jgi:hypothetical protein